MYLSIKTIRQVLDFVDKHVDYAELLAQKCLYGQDGLRGPDFRQALGLKFLPKGCEQLSKGYSSFSPRARAAR